MTMLRIIVCAAMLAIEAFTGAIAAGPAPDSTSSDSGKKWGVSIPVYGNWCGPNSPQDMKRASPPIDRMDMACKDHDLCYEALGWGDASCNRDLRFKLTDIVGSGNTSREQLNTALAILEAFEKLRDRHAENGPDMAIAALKSKIFRHPNFATITGIAPPIKNHSPLISGHKESPVDQQNLELGWSEVSKTVSQTVGINRWYIGFDDKQRVHPGIDFKTDDFYSSTTEITLARNDNLRRPFVKMSYLFPFDGRQRDTIALQPTATQGASGYDSLKIDLHLGGLVASAAAQGNEDSYFNRAHRFLTSVSVGYAITHGFGNGMAKENVAFVQAGSQIDGGVISGNVVGIAKGQGVAFHTQFEKIEIGSDLLNLTKTTDENWSVIVGGFSHRYRRPTDQSELTVSAVDCPSCADDPLIRLYDADYQARGLMIGYDAHFDYSKKGAKGSFIKGAVRYGYGLNNSAKLHDSGMDLFDGRKVYYDWIKSAFEFGYIWPDWRGCDKCALEASMGGSVEAHAWSTSSMPMFSRRINDLDRVLSVFGKAVLRF